MTSKETLAHEQLTKMITQEPNRLQTRIGRLIHDDLTAEDLAQESLVRALRNLTTLRGTADEALLCKWLDQIACHVAFNHTRDQRRRPETELPDPEESGLSAPGVDPATVIIQRENQTRLLNLVYALPREIRAVFLLRDVAGLSTAETANSLGIKEGLVKWRLNRARTLLRAQLRDTAEKLL